LLGVAAHVVERQHGKGGAIAEIRQLRACCDEAGRRLGPIEYDAVKPHRPDDVLELPLAEVFEAEIEPPARVLLDSRGDADSPRLGHGLEPRCYVDAVAIDVFAVDHHVARVDAEPEHEALRLRHTGVAFGHSALDFDGAADRSEDALESGEEAVPHGLHHPATVLPDLWLDQLPKVRHKRGVSAFLVGAHQPRITGHIGSQNGSELAFNLCGAHPCRLVRKRTGDDEV
jgi:hypothetical protein